MPRRLCAGLFAQFLLVARASSLCAVCPSFGKGLCVKLPFVEVCVPHPLPPYGTRGMLGWRPCQKWVQLEAYAMPHVCGSVRLRPCQKWVQLEAYAMPHVCGSADLCHVALTMLLSHSLKKE